MQKEFKLEQFEGPLDLLLTLIDEAKLSITEVALATVTEQFFKHLTTIDEDRSEELADFLVVGTKLVYLKSKELLPYLYPEEEDGPSLAEQLKLYKRYADASKGIGKRWLKNVVGYGHFEPPIKVEGFFPPQNGTQEALYKSFTFLLKRLKPVDPLPQVRIDRTVSVKQKVQSLYEALQKCKSLNFREVVGTAATKTDVIVSFLALLELVKQAKASIHQPNSFEDMEIKPV
jgi:segregation and condensation protein A